MSILIKITRQFSTTANLMIRHLSKRSNPGLGHQITAIEDAAEIIESDPEGFGELESDLMDAHKSHKQYEVEVKKQNAKIRQYIVERKYFRKEKLPNLLTYAEKEQIKFLHSSDKDEWTVEKLAESFPASTEIIQKVLKANWVPMSPKRIITHDACVFENWERFKRGEYVTIMCDALQTHLQKFAYRTLEDLNILQDRAKALPKQQWQRPKSYEFSSIITLESTENSKKNVLALTDEVKREVINNQLTDDTYLLGRIQNKKLFTIKELKHNLSQSHPDLKSNLLGKEATQELNHISDTEITKKSSDSQNSGILDYTEKFSTTEVVLCENDRKKYEMSTIKERIYIPRKLWRKEATYRINDCYYDNDGEFLYRVPGMISQ